MQFRTATHDDVVPLLSLLRAVASEEKNLLVLPADVTEAYIESVLTTCLDTGLMIVGIHPELPNEFIAVAYAYTDGIVQTKHVLRNLILAVHPGFRKRKIGRTLLTLFLDEIFSGRTDIGKVEVLVREQNIKAIELFQFLGFSIEGRLEMHVRTPERTYEAAIPMGRQNPMYEF